MSFNPLTCFFVEPFTDFGASAFCEVGVAYTGRVSAVDAPGFTWLQVGFVIRVDEAFDTIDVVEVLRFWLLKLHGSLKCHCSPVVA